MTSHRNLQGRRALVTGASRGIGAAIARTLAAAGAEVLVSARSAPLLQDLVEEIRSDGGQAIAFGCDVADIDQVQALAAHATQLLGGIDILVNNAGIATSATVARTTLEEWNRVMSVNATGVFLCTQAFLPGMVERRWGRVINIASVAGKVGAAYISAYSASKHAVIGFTRAVAVEVARTGVTVNAICPGYVATAMAEKAMATITGKTGRSAEEAEQMLAAMSPQQRIFRPEEVAFQVSWLCDELAAGINGQSIVLDGGAFQT